MLNNEAIQIKDIKLTSDEERIQYLARISDERDKERIILELTSDDLKLEQLENIQNGYVKSHIIESLKSDDEKEDAIKKFAPENVGFIVASFSDDKNKIKMLPFISSDREKGIVIASLKDENERKEYMLKLDEFGQTEVIMSLSSEEERVEFAKKIENETCKAMILRRLKQKDNILELMTYVTDRTKFNLLSSYEEELRVDIIKLIRDENIKVRAIGELTDDATKIILLQTIIQPYNKVKIICSLQSDDIKEEYINLAKDELEKLQIILSLKDDLKRESYLNSSKRQDCILHIKNMYETNHDILNNIDVRILEDQYIEVLGEDKINLISCYPEIQNSILSLTDKQFEVFAKCIEQNHTLDWNVQANNILNNILQYSELIDNIQSYEEIETLSIIMQDSNFFGIKTQEDLKNYEQIKRKKCDEIIENSDAINDIKQAVIQKVFGHSLEYAKSIITRFGEDILAIEDGVEKDYVLALKAIEQLEDIDVLRNIYAETEEIGLVDFTLIERNLKNQYSQLYMKDLYTPDAKENLSVEEIKAFFQIDDENELSGLNVYNAGTNFKMIISGISRENENSNYESDWNRASINSQHICTSYIRDDSIKIFPNYDVCYGFTDIAEDSLLLSSNHDSGSSGGHDFVSKFVNSERDERYFSPDKQITMTEEYNELDFRRGQGGNKTQPSYIVAIKKDGKINNIQNILSAYKDWGGKVPIVIVDVDECNKAHNKTKEQTTSKITEDFYREMYSITTAEERKKETAHIKNLMDRLRKNQTNAILKS